jgi:two-component sensor histidine kinase
MKLWKSPPSKAIILRYLLAPPIIGVVITIFSYPQGFKSLGTMLYVFFFSYCIGIPSIALVSAAGKKLDRRYPWLENPFKKLVLTIAVEVFIVLIVVVIVKITFLIIYKQSFDELFEQLSDGFLWAVCITVFGIAIANGSLFFKNWKQSALNEEILKREKLAIQYEALRMQVNPHFLFNSLTALSTLVHQDPDKAEAFIRKFSDVYRYVLDNRNLEVVSLQNELHLIQNMAYLYQYRHGKNLQISVELDPSDKEYILPMALQMLLENALKHNVLSEDRPLQVRIFEEGDYVVVWNNLQLKKNIPDSTNVGLANIRLRYSYLSKVPVEVESNDHSFQVKIPILNQT